MGQLFENLKATLTTGYLRLGGTGQPFTTPLSRDIIFADITPEGEFVVNGKKVTVEKAMSFVPFYAAVRNLSEDVAGLPLNVYREGSRQKDLSHPVQTILHDQANPFMSAFAVRETLQSHALTWGNGFAEIEFADDGSIMGLWPMRPDRCQVYINTDAQWALRYTRKNGTYVDLPRRKVFHIYGLGYDGLVGYSVIGIARSLIALATNAQEYATNSYRKGIPPAVLRHPTNLGDTAKTNLRTSLDSGELSKPDRIALLEEGMDIKLIGLPPKDAQFLQTGAAAQGMVATLFRMPPHMLQDVERSTSWGTGIEGQKIEYTTFTLRSWLVRWEQESKMSLLKGEDRYAKHVLDGLLRGDTAARWKAYESGARLGVYSIDDVLEMEDRDPLPGGLGATRMVELNRIPLDQYGQMTLEQRLDALGGLIRAGYKPGAAEAAVDVPPIDHTGLPPVTVQPPGGNGAGNGTVNGVG